MNNTYNKQKVFWMLYLSYAVLSVFLQNSVASDRMNSAQLEHKRLLWMARQREEAHQRKISVSDAVNLCNQISWRLTANNKIVDAKEGSWITDEYYSDSIRNVIGKAIADCVTGRNEFEGKQAEQTITFNVDPRKQSYTAANWNAVVLWNLIHVYNWEYKANGKCDMETAFNEVAKRIKNEYSAIMDINRIVDDAVSDIKEYARALNLGKELNEFYEVSQRLQQQTYGIGKETRAAPLLVVDYIDKMGAKEKYDVTILNLKPKTYKGVRDIPFAVKVKYGRKQYDVYFQIGCNYKCNDASVNTLWQLSIYRLDNLKKGLKDQYNETTRNHQFLDPLYKSLYDLQWDVFVPECIDELANKIVNPRNRCGIEEKINNRLVYYFDPKDFLRN